MSNIVRLAAVLYCSLTVTAEAPHWANVLDRHAQHIGNVRIRPVYSNLASSSRVRRSVGDLPSRRSVGDLPSHISFTFSSGLDHIQMDLERNRYVDTSPPVYTVHNGRITPEKSRPQKIGSYFHNGEEFSIQPIRGGGEANDVDHRISKLYHEADLQHDVIDFGSDILYAASFDGIRVTSSEEVSRDATNNTNSNESDKRHNNGDDNVDMQDIDDHRNNSSSSSNISNNNYNNNNNSNDMRFNSPSTTTVTITGAVPRSSEEDRYTGLKRGADKDENDVENDNSGDEDERDISKETRLLKRHKRQAAAYVVELLIVIDYGVFEV
ncbi:hypothetical protein ElyMa_003640000 [Elysia marginata]|uniref:Peptidase M12B propeptide domain-containing protein n=1 Tax=Elysia marginata TaxID=1093978 RepID=A0AAV4EUV8_9GAST|nr:hypothetical protein ElyMa_003640000 [Elysia marginata]